MADLGADVLKVESPTRPDLVRSMPPFDGEESAAHGMLNRSKRSIALDLKHKAARKIIGELIGNYDILLEQFRPGVMQRLGLDYETLRQINPKLIYCSITGYGQTGPYRDKAGHDINYLSLSGLMSYTGRKDSGPLPLGTQVADIAGGSYHAVMGILAAVIHRQMTGEGQSIDISMTDTAIAMNAFAAPQYLIGKELPERENMLLNGGSFYDFYQTKDGRFLSVGSLESKFLKKFCELIGQPGLWKQAAIQKPAIQEEVKQTIQQILRQKELKDWLDIFGNHDICVEPVLSLEEMVEHPQTKAREMIIPVPKNDQSYQLQVACPIKFSHTKANYQHVGPSVGAHTLEVLESLGYASEDISQFQEAGLFGPR